MALSTRLFSVLSLSLGLSIHLTACSKGLSTALSTGPFPVSSAAQTTTKTATETLLVRFAQSQTGGQTSGFRTQWANLGQIAFLRLSVSGQGIGTAIQSDWIAVNNQTLSATLSGVPQSEGQLRVVTAQAYDADKNTLSGFEAKAIYSSSASTSTQNLTVSRRYLLLGQILENLLSNDTSRLALLDRNALQTKLETMTGYLAASQTFATDPTRFHLPALVDQIAADGSVPDANALSTASLRQTSPANLTLNTTGNKPLAEELRLMVSDPSSRPAKVPSLSASGQSYALSGVAPGTWAVEAQTMAGTRVGTGSLTVDGAGTAANASLSLNGASLGKGEFQVNTNTTNAQEQPVVAHDANGNFTVVWRRVINSGAQTPIAAQRYNAAGVAQGNEFLASPAGFLAQNPAVAANGQIWVAWSSFFFPGNRVYLQRYNAAGEAQGSQFRTSSWTNHEDYPAVASDSTGNAIATWVSSGNQDGSGLAIYARLYDAAGTAQATEFRVNTTTAGDQDRPAVAMDSAGNSVIVWSSNGQDGGGKGIYAQRYNAAGVAQGVEFLVNTTTTGDQELPTVAMSSSGAFVVGWTSAGQDGGGKGIYAQRYNAAGVAQGSEFRVNTTTSDDQDNATVSMDTTGNFVFGWSSNGQDGSQNGVYAQRYNAAGTAQGTEFRANTTTNDQQANPAISLDSNGNWVAAWDSAGAQDGSDKGIFAQNFNASGGRL